MLGNTSGISISVGLYWKPVNVRFRLFLFYCQVQCPATYASPSDFIDVKFCAAKNTIPRLNYVSVINNGWNTMRR